MTHSVNSHWIRNPRGINSELIMELNHHPKEFLLESRLKHRHGYSVGWLDRNSLPHLGAVLIFKTKLSKSSSMRENEETKGSPVETKIPLWNMNKIFFSWPKNDLLDQEMSNLTETVSQTPSAMRATPSTFCSVRSWSFSLLLHCFIFLEIKKLLPLDLFRKNVKHTSQHRF